MKDIQTIVQDADTRLLSGLYHSIKERERERERVWAFMLVEYQQDFFFQKVTRFRHYRNGKSMIKGWSSMD